MLPPDPAHRLPPGLRSSDLSDEQREAIYRIQGKYYPQIQVLEKQVAGSREKREAECEAVLKPAQKRLLDRAGATEEGRGRGEEGGGQGGAKVRIVIARFRLRIRLAELDSSFPPPACSSCPSYDRRSLVREAFLDRCQEEASGVRQSPAVGLSVLAIQRDPDGPDADQHFAIALTPDLDEPSMVAPLASPIQVRATSSSSSRPGLM